MNIAFSDPLPQDIPSFTLHPPDLHSARPDISFGSLECSSRANSVKPKPPRQIPKSSALDGNRKSFLDLPGEIRNDIYRRLLICDGDVDIGVYITHSSDQGRIYRSSSTRLPCLIPLLQTCRQMHHEASSFFYARNSFVPQLSRRYQVNLASQYCGQESPAAPQRTEMISGVSQALPPVLTVDDILNIPSPRYHTSLTRLSIILRIRVYTGRRKILGEMVPDDPRIMKLDEFDNEMDEKIISLFREVHNQTKAMWEEKDSAWEGKCFWFEDREPSFRVGPSDMRTIDFTLKFREVDEA